MEWFNLAIPKVLALRIERVYGRLGYKSISANTRALHIERRALHEYQSISKTYRMYIGLCLAWTFSTVFIWSARVDHRVNPLGLTSRSMLAMKDFVAKCVIDKLPPEERKFEEIEEAIKSGEYAKWQQE